MRSGKPYLTNVKIVVMKRTIPQELFIVKVKVSPHYRPWRPTGDVEAKVHIFTATALGRDRVASPMLDRLYPRRNPPVLIL